jgi:hypothetical protein
VYINLQDDNGFDDDEFGDFGGFEARHFFSVLICFSFLDLFEVIMIIIT